MIWEPASKRPVFRVVAYEDVSCANEIKENWGWGERGERKSEVVGVYLNNKKEILNIFNIFLPSTFRSTQPNSKED